MANEDEAKKSTGPTKVNWDDSSMVSAYANVVNAFSTREEFTLLFGTNQTWALGEDKSVHIKLGSRVVMNPLVAKRMNLLVTRLLEEYESRYGALDVGVGPAGGTH